MKLAFLNAKLIHSMPDNSSFFLTPCFGLFYPRLIISHFSNQIFFSFFPTTLHLLCIVSPVSAVPAPQFNAISRSHLTSMSNLPWIGNEENEADWGFLCKCFPLENNAPSIHKAGNSTVSKASSSGSSSQQSTQKISKSGWETKPKPQIPLPSKITASGGEAMERADC